MWVRVGTFQKDSSGVASATNVITGLPGRPKAVIFVMTHASALDTTAAKNQMVIGFAVDGSAQQSHGGFSQDNVSGPTAKRGNINRAIYDIALPGGAVEAQASFSSNINGFTMTWDVNDTDAHEIGYIAIGGNGIKAEITNWTAPAATGVQSISGVGFQPDCCIHIYSQSGANNPGGSNNSKFSFGAMCADGSQFMTTIVSNISANPTNTSRLGEINSCIATITAPETLSQRAVFSSMDSDGFSVNWTTAPNSLRVTTLSLKGVNSTAGYFDKSSSAAPTTQAFTAIGFKPKCLIMSNVAETSYGTSTAHSRLSIGASDDSNNHFAAVSVDDDNVNPSVAKSIFSNTYSLIVADNSTISYDSAGYIQSFDPLGFTINYPSVNSATVNKILGVAIGGPSEHKLPSQGVGS